MTPPAPARADRRVARLLVLALATLVAALATAAPGWAHATVQGEEPAEGASVDRPPEQVRVWFDEPVEPLRDGLTVADADGMRVDLGDTGLGEDATEVVVGVPPDLPAGQYTASWRVQAGDSHAQDGSWTFTVTEAAEEDAPADAEPDARESAISDGGGAHAASTGDAGNGPAGVLGTDTTLPTATVVVALLAGLLVAGLAAFVLWRAGELDAPGGDTGS